jgi:hypothetical protein
LLTLTLTPTLVVKAVPDETRRADALALLKLFKKVTGLAPKMWGSSMVGFGSYHYKSERSRQEGDWPLTAFSPRKDTLSIYVMSGFPPLCLFAEKTRQVQNGRRLPLRQKVG